MSRELTYRDAINEAISQEMRLDSSVFLYGIDVADHTCVFGSAKNLVEEFGSDRIFSTPLSEDAMTGFALGAASNGMRPIHMHMRVDFMLLAMNQLVNMISSYRYGSGGTLSAPMVVRAVIGRGWGQSFQHSKSLHSWLAHIPGLKVVMPVSPRDAKEMMVAAIRDDNPVIVIEHRWLYDVAGDVPINMEIASLEGARVLRKGDSLTVVATSWMCIEALKAAEILAKRAIYLEVIDVRSIAPFYDDEIIKSVRRTGKCIVADNDWVYCGFSAEVASRVHKKCFDKLEMPVERLGFAHTPCPCTLPLENEFYADAIDIIRTTEKMLGLSKTDIEGEEFYSHKVNFKGPL
jgi:pyruvate dehydrogenase E1 component beta subunit